MNLAKTIISKHPKFLKPTEVADGLELQNRLEVFDSHLAQITMQARAARWASCVKNYQTSPSDEHLAALRQALVDASPFGVWRNWEDPIGKLIVSMRMEVLRYSVLPWAKPIWERALALVSKHVDSVRVAEAERILAATGKPMTRSDIVDSAREAEESLAEIGYAAAFVVRPSKGNGVKDAPVATVASLRTPAEWLALFGIGLDGLPKPEL